MLSAQPKVNKPTRSDSPSTSALVRSMGDMTGLVSLAVEAGGLAIWYYDSNTGLVGGDEKVAELFGMTVTEAAASEWIEKIHPEDRQRVAEEFAAAQQGSVYDTEYRICRGTTTRWVRAKAKAVARHDNRLIGICESVTDRRAAAAALQRTSESLQLACSTGRISSWDWNLADGEISWTEPEWSYGRPASELSTPEECFQFIYPEDREAVRQALEPVTQKAGGYRSEFRTVWPDGSIHWSLGRGQSVSPDAEGRPTRIVGVNLDITERKLTELALMQNEKLAAVGRLASSMAHELNNPLEAVTNLLYLAQLRAVSPETKTYLESAERELRRMSALTNQTLRFHKQATNASACSCLDLISGALSMYEARLLNSKISVHKRKRAEALVTCFVTEISQVIGSLIGNAIDAMHGTGGVLFLRSREGTDWRTGRHGLIITVADTGTGISPDVRKHLFEPFYSTKGIGGAGLGLWVARGIMDAHNGRILLRSSASEQRHGTVFSLFLPFASV